MIDRVKLKVTRSHWQQWRVYCKAHQGSSELTVVEISISLHQMNQLDISYALWDQGGVVLLKKNKNQRRLVKFVKITTTITTTVITLQLK